MLELTYSNGLALRIDPREVSVLKDLPRTVLMQAEVTPGGDGLVFGENDAAAISIPGLVAPMIPVDVARLTVAAARGGTHSADKAEAAHQSGASAADGR